MQLYGNSPFLLKYYTDHNQLGQAELRNEYTVLLQMFKLVLRQTRIRLMRTFSIRRTSLSVTSYALIVLRIRKSNISGNTVFVLLRTSCIMHCCTMNTIAHTKQHNKCICTFPVFRPMLSTHYTNYAEPPHSKNSAEMFPTFIVIQAHTNTFYVTIITKHVTSVFRNFITFP